jgi:hypothetical protein
MLGLLTTSIGSRQIIARWGRYKPFPIAGTAILVVGFLLLSTMGRRRPRSRACSTCSWSASVSGW